LRQRVGHIVVKAQVAFARLTRPTYLRQRGGTLVIFVLYSFLKMSYYYYKNTKNLPYFHRWRKDVGPR
jgi:hypothetical protein